MSVCKVRLSNRLEIQRLPPSQVVDAKLSDENYSFNLLYIFYNLNCCSLMSIPQLIQFPGYARPHSAQDWHL